MFNRPSATIQERLSGLEAHLKEEHPDLLDVLPTYRKMDKVLYRLGLLTNEDSLATRITWWPLISVLGTFSSGKSTFINYTLGQKLQRTGNQAVDDKFTVVCYSGHDGSRTLPGTALNNDPRFPFFGIGEEIEKVAEGEGQRIDNYLQLKTANSEHMRGRTLIDSPGFDADDQRRSTLRLTEHIIDISDLVLIFFDARHPEPGAMHDTLEHLVAKASGRADATKFVYILNQIDTAAREDNPEEVVAAWQRALAQAGVVSGRFLCIYNEDAAVPIEDDALRERFQRKRDEDMAEIERRMNEVEIERSYRVVSALENVSRQIKLDAVPLIESTTAKWRRFVLVGDVVGLALAIALGFGAVYLFGMDAIVSTFDAVQTSMLSIIAVIVAVAVVAGSWHFSVRKLVADWIGAKLPERFGDYELNLKNAFKKNTRPWHSAFTDSIAGWGSGTRRMLSDIQGAVEFHIKRLNDIHTDPSGRNASGRNIKAVAVGETQALDSLQDDTHETNLVPDNADRILESEPEFEPEREAVTPK